MKFINCLTLTSASLLILVGTAKAASIGATNVFNNGVTQATVVASDGYNENPGVFPASNIDERGNGQFFFADYQGVSPLPQQYLSLTGFNASSGIQAFNFFDGNQYEPGRVATQVSIYYSTSSLTGNSLNPADYTALNGGLAYNLPISSTSSDNAYTTTDTTSGINYDTISGLAIPIGTTSILFDFGTNRTSNGDGTGYNVGMGFSEIQAVAAPEPSTYALMGLSVLALLGICRFRQLS